VAGDDLDEALEKWRKDVDKDKPKPPEPPKLVSQR
jgi:hypothetical protein